MNNKVSLRRLPLPELRVILIQGETGPEKGDGRRRLALVPDLGRNDLTHHWPSYGCVDRPGEGCMMLVGCDCSP